MVLYPLRFWAEIKLVSVTLLVPACHHSCTGRAALGGCDVCISETNTFLGDRINVRRLDILASVTAKIPITHVVTYYNDDIWICLALLINGKPAAGKNTPGYTHTRNLQEIASFHILLCYE
jgi:hypothetical protein